ncbi:fatty acid desaturase family protein [Bacillus solimangrovi]|uniref:Fatty acid desaturase n=1 Tax=Bacillus solimangrovi TaxID=1305675 RepID=A0A1E5LH14_9BACI|nr:acyl-CoA desaturase [Bacillus solimangrovi]OEH93363.1 fatty acid desaturase [Bacillus solimangrovi]
MEKLHTFGWYAARIAPYLPKKAFQPVPERLWAGLAHLLVALAGILAIGLIELSVWVNLVISIVLGCTFASLGFLGHEILHGTVVRKAWLRDLLGGIAFFPLSTGARLWRKWHNVEHHQHTQHEEKDPDSWLSIEELANNRFLTWIYRLPFGIRAFVSFLSLTFTFTIHSLRMFKLYLKDFSSEKKPIVWFQLLLPWATWLGMFVLLGPVKWMFAFLLPLLIGNFIVMAYISTNHRLNPLVDVNDPLANSLTVTVPKWVDVLHFNFSYHTEHHLFPGMNPKYYPLVKEKVMEMWPDRYHQMSLSMAMNALWKTPRIYYKQNDLIDPNEQRLYGSLGNGLDPNNIEAKDMDKKEKSSIRRSTSG